MSRSVKKGPYVSERLLARIEAMNASGKKTVVKTWSRASTIFPQMVGHTIAVHDGKTPTVSLFSLKKKYVLPFFSKGLGRATKIFFRQIKPIKKFKRWWTLDE